MNVFAYTANNHLLTVKKIDHQKTSSSINGQIFYLYYLLLPGLISIPHKITSTQLDTPKQPSSLLPKACFSPDILRGKNTPKLFLSTKIQIVASDLPEPCLAGMNLRKYQQRINLF
ncbi:MAG: hypothetical protein EAZ09_03800 [Oscillatoriales cyanobacterium]|nr:MAG: hypothetical protein EAZ18_01085 [Oscillatoriales cyanobacterium]TAH24623.1 MAG: hypothetical protein EAZ09_03800 [Oscillatoriales cyanobacterium]